MAWIRYSDTVEPYEPNYKALGILLLFVVQGSIGSNTYALWRDWQHHRFDWMHLLGLLASALYFTVVVVGGIRRARKKSKGIDGTSKTA